jgi:hypothetical protein
MTKTFAKAAAGLLCTVAVAWLAVGATEPAEEILTLDQPQAAGIMGFRALWDIPVVLNEEGATEVKDEVVRDRGLTAAWAPDHRGPLQPGALAFDALHRSALVRFPGAAEKIAAQLRRGYAVKKVELVLPFKDTELWPVGATNSPPHDGYLYRTNFEVDQYWRHTPPRWHAVAWALRRPWQAGEDTGPTFNAYIKGAGYWARYGAQGDADRNPRRFGPTEVSSRHPEGRMDVTACLTDSSFGKTLAQRLRTLADCGFLLKKWEVYDHRYYHEVYEWATGTGGRAILVRSPRLVVTMRATDRPEPLDELPRPTDVKALARRLKSTKTGGKPTAALPSLEQLSRWAEEAARPPEWMSEAQWQRVRQLFTLGQAEGKMRPFWFQFVPDEMIRQRVGMRVYDQAKGGWVRAYTPADVYAGWVDSVLARQPRGWYGFEVVPEMMQWYAFRHALPAPARDHFRALWEAWLMPDRPTSELEHPMADKLAGKPVQNKDFVDSYYARTGDWRGDKSYYRDGFCRTISTQNINASASTGALLGGALLQSAPGAPPDAARYPIEDGRYGVENYMLRLWGWGDGASQEDIDHYYLPITLSCQKAIADYGPTAFDRLMGTSMLTRSMDEVLSAYHPALARFTAPSSRTSLEYLWGTQDGLQAILHTMMPAGAYHDRGAPLPGGAQPLAREVPPERIAQQTLAGPWAPEWAVNKPLPFEETGRRRGGAWQRNYQGRHYGLASVSQEWLRVMAMAQWRRTPVLAGSESTPPGLEDVVTVESRYGLNSTRFANLAPGWLAPMGQQAVLQHRNKMVLLANPCATDWMKEAVAREGLHSLQCSLGLFNFQRDPTWEIFVDGRKVDRLPYLARQGQRIAIHDGVAYLGVIPIPGTDLGRDAEVELHEGEVQEYQNMKFRPALVIDSFNLRRPAGKGPGEDLNALQKSYGGFVLELGDETEYGSFAAFQKHMQAARLDTTWNATRANLQFAYMSGEDVLTGIFGALDPLRHLSHCTVNGRDPYLPAGVLRDTTYSRQGTTGELHKAGMTLTTDVATMGYVRADPGSGTYMALNPLPDPTTWSLSVPGGVTLKADGKIGSARVIVHPAQRKVWVDCASRPGQAGLARSLMVSGLDGEPVVVLNGRPLDQPLQTRAGEGGGTVYLVPLP